MFHNVSEVVLRGTRTAFAVSEDASFFAANTALWRPPASFAVAGAALQACRVACFPFLAIRMVRAASSGNSMQIPWPVWHFVGCDLMEIDRSFA